MQSLILFESIKLTNTFAFTSLFSFIFINAIFRSLVWVLYTHSWFLQRKLFKSVLILLTRHVWKYLYSDSIYFHKKGFLKGCGMGPWLVLVSPCFRENVVSTYKIGSLLCSLDNLLQKNVIVLFFGNQISKWCSFEKKGYFDLLFTFFKSPGKSYKNSFSTHLTHIHTCILLTLLTFFALPILKKIRIYQVRFLFGMSPGVDSYSHHFETSNK